MNWQVSRSEASEASPKEDSMAPGGMVSVLVPWQPAQGVGWAFMDDRSTAAKSKSDDEAEKEFENILKYTEEFDRASGLVERASVRSGPELEERVEHLRKQHCARRPFAACGVA